MVRIDLLVFGYRKIGVAPEILSTATSLLLHEGISARIDSDGAFSVRERDMERLEKTFDGKIEYTISELLGLYGMYKRINCKTAVYSAIVVSLVLAILSSSIVWDIRVDGNKNIPDAAIIYELSECGFSIGDSWWLTDRGDVETKLLSAYESLSWVNINRRGTVAYVTVSEKEDNNSSNMGINEGYANIVASCDCVIEEITVSRGYAAVKIGDVVKAGDLLISGVVPTEFGSEFCYAEGIVRGRMSDTVTAYINRNYKVKSNKTEELLSVNVNIFDFSINIFKRYRNLNDGCDIIENVSAFSLFGKCKLPIKIISTYAVDYETEDAWRNDAELVRLASSRLNAATLKRLIGADLIKIRTIGDYTDDGYRMSSDIVFLGDVGETVPFTAE